jgi:hypothetical protein
VLLEVGCLGGGLALEFLGARALPLRGRYDEQRTDDTDAEPQEHATL